MPAVSCIVRIGDWAQAWPPVSKSGNRIAAATRDMEKLRAARALARRNGRGDATPPHRPAAVAPQGFFSSPAFGDDLDLLLLLFFLEDLWEVPLVAPLSADLPSAFGASVPWAT